MPRRKGTKNTSAVIIQEIINKHKQGATIRELGTENCLVKWAVSQNK